MARVRRADPRQGLLMTAAYSISPPPARVTADRFFDELRATEYARLDRDDQAYLDYTGTAL